MIFWQIPSINKRKSLSKGYNMRIKWQKYPIQRFTCLCVFFITLAGLGSGCDNKPQPNVSFQKDIDTIRSPYSFSASSFVLDDIRSLTQNNIDLQTAQNRITQAQLLYKQAYAGYLPQITAGISANQQKGTNSFMFQPQGDLKLYTAEAQISLVPDFFGRTSLRTLIAKNQIKANYLQAQALYLDILNGYTKNYHLVCATKNVIAIQKNTVKINQNIVDSLKVRYELGRSNVVDYYNAQDNLSASQIGLNKAKQNYNLALQSYYSLIGQSVDSPTKDVICRDGFVTLPQTAIAINLHDLDKRPDIQAMQYNVKIMQNNVDLSLKALYPEANLLFSIQNITDTMSNILDINQFTRNFIGQLTQLIYDGGVRDAQIESAKADMVLAKQAYYNNVVTAGNTLITLGKNLSVALKLEKQAYRRFKNATKALNAADRNYKLGNINFIDLLNSQRNHNIAHLELVSIQQDMRNLYVDVLTASGIPAIYVQ